LLADCPQVAVPEREAEAEAEAETEREAGTEKTSAPSTLHPQAPLDGIHPVVQKIVSKKKPVPDCPHEDIIRLWGEKLPTAIQPRTWTGARADALKARWREDPERQNLEWWAGFFEHLEKSDFLMGRTSGRDRGPFSITLDWLCEAKNFAKSLDGQYDNKEPQKAAFLQGCL
jgi:hypothetical protein